MDFGIDSTLRRFLKANDAGEVASARHVLDWLNWRRMHKLDELVTEWTFPEKPLIARCWSRYVHGMAIDGSPLHVLHLGSDVKSLRQHTTPSRLLLDLAVCLERLYLLPHSRSQDDCYMRTVLIVDLKHLGYYAAWQLRATIVDFVKTVQRVFPESTARIFVVNAPGAVAQAFSLILACLSARTAAKLTLSTSADVLKEAIDPGQLPESLGGACACRAGCAHSDAV